MMTPTPNPPPADPLTAEAEKRIRDLTRRFNIDLWERDAGDETQGVIFLPSLAPDGTTRVIYSDRPSVAELMELAVKSIVPAMDANAALRDRLARAEKALAWYADEKHWTDEGVAVTAYWPAGWVGASDYRDADYSTDNGDIARDALATPTDGAARAGDAAGDAERRITVVFEEQKETYKA